MMLHPLHKLIHYYAVTSVSCENNWIQICFVGYQCSCPPSLQVSNGEKLVLPQGFRPCVSFRLKWVFTGSTLLHVVSLSFPQGSTFGWRLPFTPRCSHCRREGLALAVLSVSQFVLLLLPFPFLTASYLLPSLKSYALLCFLVVFVYLPEVFF